MISRAAAAAAVYMAAMFAGPAGAAEPGRSLALAQCAQCHVVAPDQGFAPPERPRGPDFAAVAGKAKTTAKSLRRFLRTTHKNPGAGRAGMPNPLLTNAQIEDLIGFILSQAPARQEEPPRPAP